MKLSLFCHMERIHSRETHAELHAQFVELCRIADGGGMHAIWVGEHHGMEFTIAPNPFLNLVDLARRTERVRLGTATVVAPFWHPIKLAGEVAMSDHLTGGRLEVGLARGAYSFEYERLSPGLDAWTAGQRLREMLPALKRLWQGDYAHDGEHWRFPSTTAAPKPLQAPHPPLWVAARDPASHEFAVAEGCGVQVTPLWQGDAEVESLMARFEAACAKHPGGPRPPIMVLRHTYVGDSEADVEQAAREISAYYCYFGAWFKNERPVRQGLIEPLTEAEIESNEMLSPAVMRANNVIGEPDEVIERLRACESLGYDEYALWIDSGMSFERKRASLERFLRDVAPAFR